MKPHTLALPAFLFALTASAAPIADPVEWINPLMGTASKPELSNGNTYPTIALPWGMNFWTPQTGKMGNGWAYTYDADKIRGFKQTHQPYPSINREMQAGLVNDYKEGGWLPEWSSPGLANVMIGNNSASVVAEAYVKGLRGYDIDTLWQALKHGADN
jgi:putative alpha-1,2-mannosidase